MKHLSLFPSIALLFVLLFSACGGPAGPKPLPAPEELGRTVLESGVFSEELEAADADIAAYLYGLAETSGVSIYSWLSSGATAEELTFFVCADDSVLKTVKESAEARLDFQKRTFADYAPGEVPKLDGAVLRARDKVLVVCVAADPEKAANLLTPYFPA